MAVVYLPQITRTQKLLAQRFYPSDVVPHNISPYYFNFLIFSDTLLQISDTTNTFPFPKSTMHNQIVLRIVDPEEQDKDRTIKYFNENGDVVNFITFQTGPTSKYTSSRGILYLLFYSIELLYRHINYQYLP